MVGRPHGETCRFVKVRLAQFEIGIGVRTGGATHPAGVTLGIETHGVRQTSRNNLSLRAKQTPHSNERLGVCVCARCRYRVGRYSDD